MKHEMQYILFYKVKNSNLDISPIPQGDTVINKGSYPHLAT